MPKAAVLPNSEPVEPVAEAEPTEEEGVSPVKSIVITKPSVASVTLIKFGGERMIQVRKGLLERQSLEHSCLIADGEELTLFGMISLPIIRFCFLNVAQLETFPSLTQGLAPLKVRVQVPVLPPTPDLTPLRCPLMLPPVEGLAPGAKDTVTIVTLPTFVEIWRSGWATHVLDRIVVN